jgi:putative transcriptional regulator
MMSDILDAVHETAKDFYQHDHIDQVTMHHFNALCLTPIPTFDAVLIKNLRQKFGLSQGVFAEYLNVSKKLVQKWEHGTSSPKGAAAKLLALAHKNGLGAIT